MIKYLPYEEKYQDQMYDVFNELTKEEVFFKKLTKEEFSDKLKILILKRKEHS